MATVRIAETSSVLASDGVLLVGHGTRDEVGTREFFQLAECLQDQLGELPVAPCLLEFQAPSISAAWQSLTIRGATTIDIAPLLLFAAGHAKQDIPYEVARCQTLTPGVAARFARPISRHRGMIELVERRISRALDNVEGTADNVALVIVGRGSRDPCAQADLRVLSEIVGRRFEQLDCYCSFYAMAEPDYAGVLAGQAQSGRYDAVIVQPYLLFAGRIYESICQQVEQTRQRFPSTQFVVADYLGPDPMVAMAIADRLAAITVEPA